MSNADEIKRLIAKAQAEKANLDKTILWLQRQLADVQGQAVANLLRETLSVRQNCLLILAIQPTGLTLPVLLTELRKRGFNSDSENPANVVNTILNRAGRPFVRVGERWFHEKFAPSAGDKPVETKDEPVSGQASAQGKS